MNTNQGPILSICSPSKSPKCFWILSSGWPFSFWQTCKLLWLQHECSSFLMPNPTVLIMRRAVACTYFMPQKVCDRADCGANCLLRVHECVRLTNINCYIGIPGVQTQLGMWNNAVCLFAFLSELLISDPSAVAAIERPDKTHIVCVAVIMLLTRTSQAC